MNVSDALLLIPLPILLGGSAFFSGSETSLFSLPLHVQRRLSGSSAMLDQVVAQLIDETRDLLITLLLGNMVVNVLYIVISTLVSMRLQSGAAVAAFNIGSLLTLILIGEVLPKQIAARYTLVWARTIALPMMLVHRVLGPLRFVLNHLLITPLSRLIHPDTKPPVLSNDELQALLKLSQHQGVINVGEEELLRQVLDLNQVRVSELMTPRVDIIAYNQNDNDPAKLVALASDGQFDEMPVYQNDLDHIVGTVRARRILLERPTTTKHLGTLIEPIQYVPMTQHGDQILQHMRDHGVTMAIVVDEFGGTSGLITLEDIVEHMVGDIARYDEPEHEPEVQQINDDTWRVSAQLSVRDWSDVFGGMSQPQTAAVAVGRVGTIGGLIMALLGRLPRVGDQTAIGNIGIEVESMIGRRIEWVVVRLLPASSDGHNTDTQGETS